MLRTALRLGAALALSAAPALAQYGAAAPTTGTLAPPNTTASTNYANMQVSWNITQEANNLLRYTYTFTGSGAPGISHIIFSLSDNCAQNFTACVSGITVNGITASDVEFGNFGSSPSNPGIADNIFGVKINTPGGTNTQSGVMFSFLSQRVPVYGDIYIKGGSDSYMYNDGLASNSSNPADYIARPDGVNIGGGGGGSVVPEPSTYVLLASGMVGLVGVARRRKTQA